jgi:hypothetical protein
MVYETLPNRDILETIGKVESLLFLGKSLPFFGGLQKGNENRHENCPFLSLGCPSLTWEGVKKNPLEAFPRCFVILLSPSG